MHCIQNLHAIISSNPSHICYIQINRMHSKPQQSVPRLVFCLCIVHPYSLLNCERQHGNSISFVGTQENKPESLAKEDAVPRDLDFSQILAVIDKMTVMEASWHRGSVLALTIYTCHYLLHQDR